MRTHKMAAIAASLIAAVGMMTSLHAEEIRIAIEGAYPPFNWVDSSGKLAGFDPDVAQAMCDAMQADCKFVIQEWDGIIAGLIAHKYDAIVSDMVKTEDRAKKVDFSEPYFQTSLGLAVPNDSPIKDAKPESLSGYTVGGQSGATSTYYVEERYVPAGAKSRSYQTPDQMGADLVNGRIDAMVHDIYPLLDWLKHHSDGCCHVVATLPGTDLGARVTVRKGDAELANKFNAAIQAIRTSGVYQELSNKYFGVDIYEPYVPN